jgi:hypothetical protein
VDVLVGDGGTGVAVRVFVGVGVRVAGTRVNVLVGDGGLGVAVRVAVGVNGRVEVREGVAVARGVGVSVAVGVLVGLLANVVMASWYSPPYPANPTTATYHIPAVGASISQNPKDVPLRLEQSKSVRVGGLPAFR